MQTLQELIHQLTKKRNIHISVLDLSGILNTPLTQIPFANIVHSKNFCNIAKSTASGYRACLRCKSLANDKATTTKTPFCGRCVYGLYEAAHPVVIDKTVVAVVYVGGAILSEAETISRIRKTCAHTKADGEKLLQELCHCERLDTTNDLTAIAEIIADYIKALYASLPTQKTDEHWLITLMKRYAKSNASFRLSLKEFAVAHQKSVQYVGRLFKEETGVTFHEYCNDLRLQNASERLLQTEESVITIALDCGYSHIPYFNKIFKEKYGVSPTQYRKKHRFV